MTSTRSLTLWGERGLVTSLFTDLHLASDMEPWERLLNCCTFPDNQWSGQRPRSISVVVEPDFSNTGFGHPDAIFKVTFESGSVVVFIVEAKRLPYNKSCSLPSGRGGAGFNSSLNGQLELNHCLALALQSYKDSEPELVEPEWILHTPYGLERRGRRRALKNRAVIEQVAAPFSALAFRSYFHLVISPDQSDPLSAEENASVWPQTYHPEYPFQNCWRNIRPQFGWVPWAGIIKLMRTLEAEGKLSGPSMFLQSYAGNTKNFKVSVEATAHIETVTDHPDVQLSAAAESTPVQWAPERPVRGGYKGVRMIFAPDINSSTFLHFSWQNESCALRDYSKSPTIMPMDDRSMSTSEVWIRVRQEIPIRNRKPIGETAYWHETTVNLNRSELERVGPLKISSTDKN